MTGQRRNLVTRLSADRNSHLTNFGDSSQFLIGRKVGRTLNFKLRVVHECGQGAQHRLHFPIRNAAPSNGRPVPLRESSSESTRFRSLFFHKKIKEYSGRAAAGYFHFLLFTCLTRHRYTCSNPSKITPTNFAASVSDQIHQLTDIWHFSPNQMCALQVKYPT